MYSWTNYETTGTTFSFKQLAAIPGSPYETNKILIKFLGA